MRPLAVCRSTGVGQDVGTEVTSCGRGSSASPCSAYSFSHFVLILVPPYRVSFLSDHFQDFLFITGFEQLGYNMLGVVFFMSVMLSLAGSRNVQLP